MAKIVQSLTQPLPLPKYDQPSTPHTTFTGSIEDAVGQVMAERGSPSLIQDEARMDRINELLGWPLPDRGAVGGQTSASPSRGIATLQTAGPGPSQPRNILDDLTYNQKVLGTGGATLGGLGIGKALEYSHDINKINQWANMGYGKGNSVPQHLRDTLKGSWVPNKTFEKMGLGPGSTKNWFFNTISDKHFKPVQDTIKFAKNIPGYAMKGLGYLASLPALAASMTLSSTPVGSAEMPEYGSEEYKALMAREALFRRKQKQANVFKQMKQKQLADEAAKKKITTGEPPSITQTGSTGSGRFKDIKTSTLDYGPHTKTKKKKVVAKHSPHGGGPGSGGGGQRGSNRGGFTDPGKGSYGPWKADGGLIDFYRYGGFI